MHWAGQRLRTWRKKVMGCCLRAWARVSVHLLSMMEKGMWAKSKSRMIVTKARAASLPSPPTHIPRRCTKWRVNDSSRFRVWKWRKRARWEADLRVADVGEDELLERVLALLDALARVRRSGDTVERCRGLSQRAKRAIGNGRGAHNGGKTALAWAIRGAMAGMRPRTAYSALSRWGLRELRFMVFVWALGSIGDSSDEV
jgi:hypothetical protein